MGLNFIFLSSLKLLLMINVFAADALLLSVFSLLMFNVTAKINFERALIFLFVVRQSNKIETVDGF